MYHYQAFGLNIQTELALPELFPGEESHCHGSAQTSVTICFGKLKNLPTAAKGVGRYIWPTPDGIQVSWADIGTFLICKNGQEVIVDPFPGTEESLLRLFTLGTTLAMLLHQRGETAVLHSSVVVSDGHAIAFLGAKGTGKSTMAAALLANGCELLSDDILAVDLRQDKPIALPGFPHMKFWPDTLAALGFDAEKLPRLRPELEKRGQRLSSGFSHTPKPLKHIFMLDAGPELTAEPLHAWDALNALIPNWYGARFGADVLRALGLPNHFLQCAELARKVSVSRLKRPVSLDALPKVAQLVQEYCANSI